MENADHEQNKLSWLIDLWSQWSLGHRQVGLAVSTFALLAAIVIVNPSAVERLLPSAPSKLTSSMALENKVQYVTAGPLSFRHSFVQIKIPASMRENQTVPVVVTYRLEQRRVDDPTDGLNNWIRPPISAITNMDGRLKISLKSPAFGVEPEAALEVEERSLLPITNLWAITPKGEGDHILLLKVAESVEGTFARNLSSSAKLNDGRIEPLADGSYAIPIQVTTYWGLPKVITSLIGGLCGLIAFALAFPIVVDLLRKRFFPALVEGGVVVAGAVASAIPKKPSQTKKKPALLKEPESQPQQKPNSAANGSGKK